jgi:hypothetical protein
MGDELARLLGIGGIAAAGGLLTGAAYQRLGDIGEQARREAGTLAQQQLEQTQFRPFTVTTGTGGALTTTPEGGLGVSLSPQEQAISQQLMGQAGQIFGQPVAGQAQLTQAGLGALGAGQQLMGQPTFGIAPTQAAAQQAFGLGGQFMGAAGAQPADINLLRGQFAGAVGGLMGQQPSAAVGQLGQQALGLGGARLAGGAPDVTQTFAGVQAPGVRTAAGDLAARGLGLGMAGLETVAPSDVEALRQQYGGLAGQAAQQVLQPTGAREAEVFERIRATQRPEEERQRLALEQRLAAQGRLGTRSAAYGGATPEQLAMATAQEEARNRASLSAIQQAQAERQQSLGEAQALGGMFTQQAGLSSQLQSQAQQRASQLSQLGLSAERVQAQLEAEGFGREMQLAGAGLQAQQAQSALESQAQQRATQLAQLGLSAEQIQSRLQTEGLGRATTAAGQAAQLAQVAGGLQAQQAGLGAQFAGLGANLAGQQQALDAARQQQALQALTAGQGLLGGGLGLQQLQQQIATGALGTAYLPQAQALNVLQAGLPAAELAQRAQLQGAGLFGQAEMGGLQALLGSGLGQAELFGQLGTGLLSGLATPNESGGSSFVDAIVDYFG